MFELFIVFVYSRSEEDIYNFYDMTVSVLYMCNVCQMREYTIEWLGLSREEAGRQLPLPYYLACGSFAGVIAGTALYPNDTIRRIMQVSENDRYKGLRGVARCYRETYSQGGLLRLFRGLTPYLVRMAPNTAIQFTVYEKLKAYLAQLELA